MDAFGFLLKKTIAAVLLPPGILLLLFLAGMLLVRKRFRSYLLILLLLVYALSIEPTKDLLLLPLENSYRVPEWNTIPHVDAIVVLGGGSLDNAPDIDGQGMLSSDSLARVVTAYRLHMRLGKPIIASGGASPGRKPESEIARDVLQKLGMKQELILTETESKDTAENALFVSSICRSKGWSRILLVTSAYHMRRSLMLFGKHFSDIVPCPTDYKTSRARYDYLSFLPDASKMADIVLAMREYLGLTYYKITL
jgi:uncharacterized SAM-binding protein YcdF (DUF218 family)